jgi:hypothetical protein
VTQKLLKAEETLRNYAKQWETKQQSMKMVKSKLLKKKFAIFGTENLDDSELQRTPYLISLSCDPLLNLAVKVYLPSGNILRIGKTIDGLVPTNEGGGGGSGSGSSVLIAPDLQIDGLGIEIGHCELRHQESGAVLLTSSSSSAITYVNGRQLVSNTEEEEAKHGVRLCGGDRIVLGVCSHIFAFIDPRAHDPNPSPAPPTYEQALREVILGRGETDNEKKERLASMVRTGHCHEPFSLSSSVSLSVSLCLSLSLSLSVSLPLSLPLSLSFLPPPCLDMEYLESSSPSSCLRGAPCRCSERCS